MFSGLVQPKLSKEEQKKLLEERLAKNRENKAKQDKELEKQQELSRIAMNKELNEVFSHLRSACILPQTSSRLFLWAGAVSPEMPLLQSSHSVCFFLRLFANNLSLFFDSFSWIARKPHPRSAAWPPAI